MQFPLPRRNNAARNRKIEILVSTGIQSTNISIFPFLGANQLSVVELLQSFLCRPRSGIRRLSDAQDVGLKSFTELW